MALVPVQTVGNAQFSRFELTDDGRVKREVYLKDASAGFHPVNVDQPMRYVMSFLLEQFANRKKSWLENFLSAVFLREDLKEVAEYIREDIKTHEDRESGIAIFCGHHLLGFS